VDTNTPNAGLTNEVTPPSLPTDGAEPSNGDTKPSLPPVPTPAEQEQLQVDLQKDLAASARKSAAKYRRPRFLDKKSWSQKAVEARIKFGEFLTVPVVSQIQIAGCIESLEQLKMVIGFGTDIASGIKRSEDGTIMPDYKISDEDRINAVTSVAEATKIYVEASTDMVKLAEFANGKHAGENGSKPKNKPPSIAMETVAPDGTTTRAVATSGEAEQ
jgi:hypothetical protein